jgi:hypothetical protein
VKKPGRFAPGKPGEASGMSDDKTEKPIVYPPARIVAVFLFTLLFTLLPMTASLVLTGCSDPYEVRDDAVRDIDRPRAELADIPEPSVVDVYDTLPTWTWDGDPSEGTGVFRYRLNGGEWIVENLGVPPYSYTPPTPLYPDTYRFEVEERNAAGTWSEACSHTLKIYIREPVITEGPITPTNNNVPYFSWVQWLDTGYPPQPQNGASGTFSWRVEARSGSSWFSLADLSGDNRTDLSCSVSRELPDGIYRFGVAERNLGGGLSRLFHTEGISVGDYVSFRVDTAPPNPPIISGADLLGSAGNRYVMTTSPNLAWTSGGPDGTGEYEYRLDGGEIQPSLWGSNLPLPGLILGNTYTLEVREYDEAGNVSPWAAVTFSVRSTTSVTIDLSNPSQPVIDFSGHQPELNRLANETMAVSATAGFDTYQWYLNGALDHSGPTYLVDSTDIPYGAHRVTLVVTSGGVPYSAEFDFTVVGVD